LAIEASKLRDFEPELNPNPAVDRSFLLNPAAIWILIPKKRAPEPGAHPMEGFQ
jgi:hypothetical protein